MKISQIQITVFLYESFETKICLVSQKVEDNNVGNLSNCKDGGNS